MLQMKVISVDLRSFNVWKLALVPPKWQPLYYSYVVHLPRSGLEEQPQCSLNDNFDST